MRPPKKNTQQKQTKKHKKTHTQRMRTPTSYPMMQQHTEHHMI